MSDNNNTEKPDFTLEDRFDAIMIFLQGFVTDLKGIPEQKHNYEVGRDTIGMFGNMVWPLKP